MTSAEPRRRRDVKTQDREKSLSPLDKDHLKQRCLARVRTERSRLMARMRGRQGLLEAGKGASGGGASDAGACADSPLAAAAAAAAAAAQGSSALSAREILRQGLSELSGGNSRHVLPEQQQQQPQQQCKQAAAAPQPPLARQGVVVSSAQHAQPSSFLSAIEEENATYLDACAGGAGRSRHPRPPIAGGTPPDAASRVPMAAASLREELQGLAAGESDDALMVDDSRQGVAAPQQLQLQPPPPPPAPQQQQQEPEAMVEGEELGWGDEGAGGYSDDEHLLSPEEYMEMMEYIEEACREEGLRAEAEVCIRIDYLV